MPYSGMPMFWSWRARGMASVTFAPLARTAETTNSSGVFTLARYASGTQNSGEWNKVFSTSPISPFFFKNVCAMRSTRVGGGLSDTKRIASFAQINFAVVGCRASRCSTSRPSFSPLDLMRCPRMILSPGSCIRSSKVKPPPWFGLLQSPSGENSRDLSDIFLSVAAVDSERVQFHKLAPIVFIQAGTPSLALLYNQRTVSCAPSIAFRNSVRNIGVRSHAQPIVQIEQHRRTLRSRDQQVLKFSQRMRANHVPLIAGQQVAVGALADEYVEVVEPKVGHHFLQLTLAVDGPQQLGLHQFVKHNLLWIIQCHESLALFRVHTFKELIAFIAFERCRKRPLILRRHSENFSHPLVRRKIENLFRSRIGITPLLAVACAFIS